MINSNDCDQIINLKFSCIKLMEYTNITLLNNKYHKKLIDTEYAKKYKLYPLCIFQFVTLKSVTKTSPIATHYSININDNSYLVIHPSANK